MHLIERDTGVSVRTDADRQLFFVSTDRRYRTHIHPLNVPGCDRPLTRFRPVDHPWQYGVFTGLNGVNGIDFWCSGDAYYERSVRGTMRNRELKVLEAGPARVTVTDVYETEPLPDDDPILGRENVIHLPHIAGRTRDANLRLADILADDILRVLNGVAPTSVLTAEAIAVRTGKRP